MSNVVSMSPPVEMPSVIDGRYAVERLLGRGGMALVFAVRDNVRGRLVALKRMLPPADPSKRGRNLELFEREFSLLAQLAHPRIVQTFDFGVDCATDTSNAYYTMELLEGRELQSLAPLPWRAACAVARDVCSALSLLHSRRYVHRDVSPRNVHCLTASRAKLIDFGVVAQMGSTKLLVGTPPCVAPESINLQSLDGRTDLFALGATLYFALVGHHAFPAARFSDLPELWRRGIVRPSAEISDIPVALDALVLDLLRLEPDARPASAAEVMHRLSAIDGLSATDEHTAAAAYLATPPLVGREAELAHVRSKWTRAPDERARSVLFEGPPGVGRTRLLDACALQATLHGFSILRADADDADSGDYGVVRALARQLFEHLGELARDTSAALQTPLAGILPNTDLSLGAALVPRSELQEALQKWLLALFKRHPVVVAVDDFHRIDEPSASLLLLLENHPEQRGLCLLLTAEAGAAWTAHSARKLLASVARIELANLTYADSEKLLSSLFADAPHSALLAQRAHDLCHGNPRDLLRFAQHCIDRGHAHYSAGAWTLPAELDPNDLPSNISQALSARIATLDAPALRLGWALALCADQSFALTDCALLSREQAHARVRALHEQLTSREIARIIDDRLALAHPSWIPLLRATLSRADEVALERELGAWFEARAQELRAAKHWFRAGEPAHALDILVEHSRVSQEQTAHGAEIFAEYLRALPDGWFETFEEGLQACDKLGRPKRDKFELLSRLSGIMPMLNLFAPQHVLALFAMLARDSGLGDWAELARERDPAQRLTTALGRAQARFEAAAPNERVVDVKTAIQFLVRSAITASAGVTLALDLKFLRSWPQLTPLAALSPAIATAIKLVEGVDARCSGRKPRTERLYTELVERVSQPDRAGMDASHAGFIALGVLNGLGMLEAIDGKDSCLSRAERIAKHPSYAINAMLIRMLYQLFQGNVQAAEAFKRDAERLRIQNVGRPVYEGQQLIGEVQAYTLGGDLTRLRNVQHEIAPLAKRFAGWMPVLLYAKAEYQRLLGAPEIALQQLEAAMEMMHAGTHQIWGVAASAHVLCLLECEQVADAEEYADGYLHAATKELEYTPERLGLACALARAHAGDGSAVELADGVISEMQSNGFGKLPLGAAHETRAHIALVLGEREQYTLHEAQCRELWSTQKNAALTARCHRLTQAGWRTLNGQAIDLSGVTEPAGDDFERIGKALGRCADAEERARLALVIVAGHTHAAAGALFNLGDHGPYCAAQHGSVSLPESWTQLVADLLAKHGQRPDQTVTGDEEDELPMRAWIDSQGRTYQPIILWHADRGMRVITGVAVLATSEDGDFQHGAATAAAAAISRYYAGIGSMSLSQLME